MPAGSTTGAALPRLHRRSALLALLASCAHASRAQAPNLTLTAGRIASGDVLGLLNRAVEPIVDEAVRRIGYATRYVRLPPLRSIEAANAGETDIEPTRILDVLASYPNLIAVPTPVARGVMSIYAATPTIATRTRAEIQRMRFGIVRGHLLSQKLTSGMRTTEGNTPALVFDMLMGGRCDVVLVEHFEGAPVLVEHPQPEVHRWPYAWGSVPTHMMLNRKHAALVPRLDDALQQMTHEGFIERAYADGLRANRIGPPPPIEPR